MGNTTFKGVYKPKNGITSSQRDLVKAMGRTLRCEGVVEYAHEWYGIRIYGTDSALFSQVAHWDVTWGNVINMDHHSGTAITPKSQAQDYMTQVISYPPTGTYK